ncbi:MAG: DUF998 domain-containing protein [Nitrososphaerota archaeon]|jgi:hypothetical protein|nr:DUF998 domain-containing protein [Nitrososphaerota archaeon]MDG6953163.1 DUF998 domain-containing protein [Nitrososphaerota archaeon]MDG6976898.1 DUF998 domain-containing protein [Nitrososphaerota archaeon]
MIASAAPGMVAVPDEAAQARRARSLFVLTLALLALYVILDAVAQALPPHYSPISQAESDLAVGPYGYVMTLNFVNRGVLSLCFLFALALAANSSDTTGLRFRRGGYFFAAWAVGSLLLAAFPTDVPPTPVSWHGAVHLLLAVVAFAGAAVGALYISLGMSGNRELSRARGVAVPLAYLSAFLCAVELLGALVVPGLFAHYGGLTERLFLGSVLAWMGAVSARMLTKQSEPPPTI